MTRIHRLTLALALLSLTLIPAPPLATAQQLVFDSFPASALIRGENVWLRLDPAADAEVLALLQRGDSITITGESVQDGDEVYYPVELDLDGETGWIAALFIDPRSIANSSTVVPGEVVDVPDTDPEASDDEATQRQQDREARRQARQSSEDPAAATADEERAARRAERQAAREAAAQEEQPADDRATRRAERQAQREAAASDADVLTDALTFSGTESIVTPEFTVPADAVTVSGGYEGDGRFIVLAVAPDGAEETIFRERGPFTGDTTFETDSSVPLVLDVQANGPWEIVIEPAS